MRRRRQQEAAREAQRTSLSTAKATSSTQRPQTCTEAATKLYNTPIQEKTGSCMEARPKGPSAFAAPGGKNKWLSKKVSRWSL